MNQIHDPDRRGFSSDNSAAVHPEVMEALLAANGGHLPAYGADPYTERLQEVIEQRFGPGARAYPVFNGTGANVIALRSMLPAWGAVVCAESAHVNTDENAAPERIGGIKLWTVPAPDGKLTPELVDRQAWGWGNEHRAQPLAISLTQSSELGTVYSLEELSVLAAHAHGLGMAVHVDGARLANAAAALEVSLQELTTAVGIDVVSFGGTKNGLMFGEAVVVLDPSVVSGMEYLRKMSMQLASKMRFVSAQLLALLEGDLWLSSARHANEMARRLRAGAEELPEIRFTQATEANALFAVLPPGVADEVRQRYRFYDWDSRSGEVRWMCSWDTTEDDVDGFLKALAEALGNRAAS
ncbi:MAG: low specificity L-threonine aldolase [Acidimicrobiaceae bacterium]|nr:low specificity L-threonine aldolase [Acidimicrobiaceae bacterium]